MNINDIPVGFEPIFSEVKYADFKDIDIVESWIRNELSIKTYITKKDLYFRIEQKLSGYRPNNKYYVGGEIMFIVEYIEPRTSVQHDMVMDTEICVLHPQYFDHKDLEKLVNKLKNE